MGWLRWKKRLWPGDAGGGRVSHSAARSAKWRIGHRRSASPEEETRSELEDVPSKPVRSRRAWISAAVSLAQVLCVGERGKQ